MARQRRVPATRSLPRVELLEIQCVAVSIIRDGSGKIIGKGNGALKEIHSVEEFTEYFEDVKRQEKDARKELG